MSSLESADAVLLTLAEGLTLTQFSIGFFSVFVLAPVFLLGGCLGSFINVIALRSAAGLGWVRRPSHCPYCQARLSFMQNLPFYGWLRHGGRAGCCGENLSWRYLLVELICAMVLLFAVVRLGWMESLIFLPFFIISGVIFLTDLDRFHIPDAASLGGLSIGLLLAAVQAPGLPSVSSAFMAAIFGFGLLAFINFCYRLWRGHDGLGFGDMKLMAMFGVWLGASAILPILFLASFFGALVGIGGQIRFLWSRHRDTHPVSQSVPSGRAIAQQVITEQVIAEQDIAEQDTSEQVIGEQDIAERAAGANNVLPFGCFLVAIALLWVLARDVLALPIILMH